MQLYRITIPKDDAWKVIESLGNRNRAHFIDMNKGEQLSSKRPYAARLKLCDDAERRIAFLMAKCNEMMVRTQKPDSIEDFEQKIQAICQNKQRSM